MELLKYYKDKIIEELNSSFLLNISKLVPLFIPKDTSPKIYKAYSKDSSSKYTIKLINCSSNIIGEENIEDIIFDPIISDILRINNIYPHSRGLIGYIEPEFLDNHILTIQNYVEGPVIDNILSISPSEYRDRLQNSLVHLLPGNGLSKKEIMNTLTSKYKLSNQIKDKVTKKVHGMSEISFMKHFMNDVKRVDIHSDIKSSLMEKIEKTKYFDSTQKKFFLHGDIKGKNIISSVEGIVPIDWSASHFGSLYIDIADSIISLASMYHWDQYKEEYKKFINFVKDIRPSVLDEQKILNAYLAFKMFSIVRVWHPSIMSKVINNITEYDSLNTADFLRTNDWLYHLEY